MAVHLISALCAVVLFPLSLTAATTESPRTAQAPRFQRQDDPEPPHRSVFALHQDSEGFLWIGTQDGLAQFDGYEMRTFRHDPNDSKSLSNSSVRVILEDRQGQLWIGTENGLNRLDRHRFQVNRLAMPDHREGDGAWFHCALEDRNGLLWFGTNDGLITWAPTADAFHRVRFDEGKTEHGSDSAVVAMQEDHKGNIWIVTANLEQFNLNRLGPLGAIEERYLLNQPGSNTYAFLIDSDGRFWAHPKAPVVLGHEIGSPETQTGLAACPEPRAAIEAHDGSIWIACDDGLYRTQPESGESVRHMVVQSAGTWLENYGRALLEDRSGIIWVGTEGGLYRFDPHAKAFTNLQKNPNNPKSLSANAVSAIAEAPNGDLWVSTYGGGLNRVDRKTGAARQLCSDPEAFDRCTSEVIWHVHSDGDGRLWVAGDELWSLDPIDEMMTLHSPEGVIHGYITYIAEDDSGVLWLGGLGGRLYRYSVSSGEFEVMAFDFGSHSPEVGDRIDALLHEGHTLWIGTGHALVALDPSAGTFEVMSLATPDGSSLASLGTWAIHRGRDGDIWLGTSVGLIRFVSSRAEFSLLTTHDGLPGSAVYSILEDDDGFMWLGTNQGLARFDRSRPAGEQFRSFTTVDGVGNVEFNRHAAFRGLDGTLFFGGMDGLTSFHPEAIRGNTYVPPVCLTGVEVGSREGVRVIDPGGLQRLVLGPGDSTVGFRFAALSFTAPARNLYAYRLEGFDAVWTEAGTRRTTQYTNLPPGKYRFRVKGSNNDGVWNEEGAALELIVRPTLWQTWWLRPAVVLVLAGVAWSWCLYRVAKKRELERLRMRIAGDLHDDLSSDLSGVAILADMVRQADDLGHGERKDLGDIRDAALRMADGLRDIVWYIDPDHDSLQATVRRMKSVSATLLRGLSCDFSADLPERSVALPVNTRRNLFLIFKEAVHNVARHAEAARVEIEIEVSGDSLRLRVADDGCGFDPDNATDGHGMRSMQRRTEEVGGRLEIQSAPGRGVELLLTVNMAGSRDGRNHKTHPMLGGGNDFEGGG